MKKTKVPSIISLAILTLITSIFWIFFSLYRVFTDKSEPKVFKEILESFSPSLNEEVISEIENRVFIEQNQIPENMVSKQTIELESPSPEPTLEETVQESTESANLEE